MDTNNNPSNEREGWQHQGESLNTSSSATGNDPRTDESAQAQGRENQKHDVGALRAAAAGRSATAQVDPHSNSGLANTGTNISYEGPTAPGAGGSVGTGYASGKSAVDPRIATSSDEDAAMRNPSGTNGTVDSSQP